MDDTAIVSAFQLHLAAWHPTAEPKAISDGLRVEPDGYWTKGERVSSRGHRAPAPSSNTRWSAIFKCETDDIGRTLDSFFEALARRAAFIKTFVADGGTISVWPSFSLDDHYGFAFGVKTLRAASDLQVRLGAEIFMIEQNRDRETFDEYPDVRTFV